MFRYHFLSHFLAELNEISCGSLLNSILKTYRRKFFYSTKSEKISNLCCVFHAKIIENVLCNKSKNASVHFFIHMSSMCVQLFTAFEVAVLKLYVPW